MSPRAKKLAVLVAVAGLVVGLLASGSLQSFSLERTTEFVRASGPWGAVVYLLAFAFLQPLGLSGNMFTVVAGLIWPTGLALFLALTGAVGSAMVNVAFARYVAYDWVQARIPPRLRRYERWLSDRGLWGVVMYRAVTFTLHPAQLLIGVVQVPVPRLVLGTVLGFIPAVVMGVVLGGQAVRWVARALGLG